MGIPVAITAERRFLADTLAILGTGGFIGGAISGLFDKKVFVLAAGVFGGIGGCVLAVVGTFLYTATPWPSPQPYPDTKTHVETDGGSWGLSRSQTYTVTVRLDDIQKYYSEQMSRYRGGSWQFQDSPNSNACRESECQIRRFWMEQYFSVHICSISETQTKVIHIDMWQD